MGSIRQRIAIVIRETRLQGLLQRWATVGAARFRLGKVREHQRALQSSGLVAGTAVAHEAAAADAEFAEYESENTEYRQAIESLRDSLDFGLPIEIVDRRYVPNFDFSRCLLVVVLGQDGLVANVAKYVGDLPIVAVNPDPSRFDGILLPFEVDAARSAVQKTLRGKHKMRSVTLAQVELNDGQRLLAFNDFFVGVSGHTSARYLLSVGGKSESQSSSGVLVSTGAGSTGWFSSIFNMTAGVSSWQGVQPPQPRQLAWEDRELLWVVREPFESRHSSCRLVAGSITANETIVLESLVPERGVIFSDGIESDYLEFNSGTIARIGCAAQCANLVVP